MELHWRVARGQAPRSWQSLLSGWSVEIIRARGRKEKEDLSVKSAFVFDGWHSTWHTAQAAHQMDHSPHVPLI